METRTPQSATAQQRYRHIRRATLASALGNTAMATFKIALGLLGSSSALVADGFHSFSDLLSDALVLIASKAGMKEPDIDHPYGHQRIETLATTLIATLLIVIGLFIAYENTLKLWQHELPTRPSQYTLWVAAISIVISECLYRYSFHIGKKVNSPLLISNAYHQRSDAMISVLVVVSIIGSLVGLRQLDMIGAFIIAIFIIKMGAQMIWHSLRELIDTAVDEDTTNRIKEMINSIPSVVATHQIRSRTLAGQIYLDLHVMVQPKISVSEGHHIAEQTEKLLKESNLNIKDVTVHIDPEDDEVAHPSTALPDRQQLTSLLKMRWQQLDHYQDIDRLQFHYLNGKLHVEVYFKNIDLKSLNKLKNNYLNACKEEKDILIVDCFIIANASS